MKSYIDFLTNDINKYNNNIGYFNFDCGIVMDYMSDMSLRELTGSL